MQRILSQPCHRLIATFLVLLASLWMSRAPAADFAANFGGTTAAGFSRFASAIDALGNVYSVGTFNGVSLSIGNITVTRMGSTDAVVAKFDALGDVVWVKNFGGSGATTIGSNISVDASGNVYLGGSFRNGNLTTPALTRIGNRDAFALKLDSAGNSVWSKNFGGSGTNVSSQYISVDASSNVYLAGYFEGANLTTPALTKIGNREAFAFKLDNAGNSVWAKNFGGSGADAECRGIAVDASGNFYLAGFFRNANLTTPALTIIGSTDAFALKLDSAGNSVWAKNFGGGGASAFGQSIAVDSSSNVYLGGQFQSASLSTPALTIIGSTDAFAVKLDSVGTSVWARNFGGSGANTSGDSIAVDASSNVYLGGYFQSANLTTPALNKIGGQDAFAFKLDSAGTSVWSRNFGGIGAFARGESIAVDASGNVYLGGNLSGANLTTPALTLAGDQNTFAFTLDNAGSTTLAKRVSYLAPGGNITVAATAVDAAGNTYLSGNFNSITATFGGITLSRIGTNDVLVAKLNAAGTVLWAKNFGGSGANANSQSIVVDASSNVYIAGVFQDANLTTPALTRIGIGDAFAVKLDSAGNSVWAKNFGGFGADTQGHSIAVDASGNVYLGGFFGAANLTTPAITKTGNYDAFAFKLDSAGNTVWSKNFGGSGAFTHGQGIAVDASGNVYVSGYFYNNANLTSPALTRIGIQDAFAFKLDSAGISVWARNFGGSGAFALGKSIAVDASGNVYLGGDFGGANLTTPALTRIGSTDAFALKLDSAGVSVWSKNFGGSFGANAFGRSIAADSSSNVYLGGYFGNANLTNPALTKIGGNDAFAFKLDSAGTNAWSRNFGGSGVNVQSGGLAVDTSGNVFLGGSFSGANLTTPALAKIGTQDAFIIKRLAANPPSAPTAVTATAGSGQATVTFTAPISDGGSAITGYTVTSIPAGGTDSNAGSTSTSHVVTGLTNGAAYTFTVVATNAAGASPASAVSNSVTPIATTTTTVTTSASPVAAGSAVTFTATVSGAPAGSINFRSDGGTISGCGAVALVAGSAQCPTTYSTIGTRTIDADYSGNASNAASTGVLSGGQSVIAPTIVVSPTSLPNGTFNVAYNQTITASGGTAAYSFAVTAGTLPGGLSLSTGGVLSGTASAGGVFNFTVTATDANSFTGAQAYTVTINATTQTVTFAPASPVVFGASAITLTATASSGLTTFTFTTGSAASICTVAGDQLTIVGAGTCALTATQAGNANYSMVSANADVVVNQPQQTLTVTVTGTGQGSVTGTGINCPGDCSEAVTQGTMVTLTATPTTGSTFTGWSGGGGCTGTGTCTVTMSAATTVTAQFTRQLGALSVTLSGLSAGGSVALAITGPDGYSTSHVVTTGTTLTLSNLPTGTYLVNAPATTISTVFYLPNLRLNSAEVTAGMTTNITITYRVALYSVEPMIFFFLED